MKTWMLKCSLQLQGEADRGVAGGAWFGAASPVMARRGAGWLGESRLGTGKGRVVGALFVVWLLAGCAGPGIGLGLGTDIGSLNAEQLKALANDKSSAAACTQFVGAGGTFSALYVNNDRTFGSAGGRTQIECGAAKVSFEDSGKAPPTPPTPRTTRAPTVIDQAQPAVVTPR